MSDVNITLRTPPVRLSYANVVQPKQYKEDGKPKGDPTYNTELILPVDGLTKFQVRGDDGGWQPIEALNTFLATVAKQKWGSEFDIKAAVEHGGMKWPILDGNAKIAKKEEGGKKATNMDQYADKKIIRGKSALKYPPRLYVREEGTWVKLDRDSEEDMAKATRLFASGNYVVAAMNLRPNVVDGRKFLTFYLNDIMFYEKGEPLGGADAASIFSGYEGGESDFDPSEGISDSVLDL